MLVLFDHGTPKGLARALSEHTVHTAQSRGWDKLSNGALLDAADEAGFELLLTTDRRIRHQQNLRARRIALVVLTAPSGRWFGGMSIGSPPPLLPRRLAVTSKSRFPSSRNRPSTERHVANLGASKLLRPSFAGNPICPTGVRCRTWRV